MLNISIFGGGGALEVIFWKLEFSLHTYLLFFFPEITILSYKELDKNRDFSIILLIETFLFFLNVKIIEKRVNKSFVQ